MNITHKKNEKSIDDANFTNEQRIFNYKLFKKFWLWNWLLFIICVLIYIGIIFLSISSAKLRVDWIVGGIMLNIIIAFLFTTQTTNKFIIYLHIKINSNYEITFKKFYWAQQIIITVAIYFLIIAGIANLQQINYIKILENNWWIAIIGCVLYWLYCCLQITFILYYARKKIKKHYNMNNILNAQEASNNENK